MSYNIYNNKKIKKGGIIKILNNELIKYKVMPIRRNRKVGIAKDSNKDSL